MIFYEHGLQVYYVCNELITNAYLVTHEMRKKDFFKYSLKFEKQIDLQC